MGIQTIEIFDRKDFRKWLKINHKKEDKVCVILYKKHTGRKIVSHRELIEEAICFGWIDTTVKRIDEEKYMRNFSRRNEKSKWSDNTLRYGKELLENGRMSQFGIEMYLSGKGKKTLDHGIPKNPEIPLELKKELDKKTNEKAKKNFDNFSPSYKKMIYRWYLGAKLEKTKEKRIKIIINLTHDGKKIF